MREGSRVPERPPILIAVATPPGVEVDVLEAMSSQAGRAHRIGLRQNILLIHYRAGGYNRLLAECAPAKIWPFAYAICLSDGIYCSERQGQDDDRYQAKKMQLSMQLSSMAYANLGNAGRSQGEFGQHSCSPQ